MTVQASSCSKIPFNIGANASGSIKSQLKSPSVQLGSALKQPQQVTSKPAATTKQTVDDSKPLKASNLSSVSLTTFQSNNSNNIARIVPYSANTGAKVADAVENVNVNEEEAADHFKTANLSANVKKMQQNFKEGMQAVKHSIQFTVCDVVEDETVNQNQREEKAPTRHNPSSQDVENDDDELKEDFILGISDTDRLNANLIDDANEEFQHFLAQINEK